MSQLHNLAAGLNPAKDVKRVLIPWEALPKLNDYVAEGFKTGEFDAAFLIDIPVNPDYTRPDSSLRRLFPAHRSRMYRATRKEDSHGTLPVSRILYQ